MYKEFAIGDIHGRIDALKEVLQASNFDYDNDKLIVLGDVVDGGINTATVIDELIKIKNLVLILGNHDLWFIDYICNDKIPVEWVNQGGANTLNSYGGEVIPNVMFNIDAGASATGLKIPTGTPAYIFILGIKDDIEKKTASTPIEIEVFKRYDWKIRGIIDR